MGDKAAVSAIQQCKGFGKQTQMKKVGWFDLYLVFRLIILGIFIDTDEQKLPPDHEYSQWDLLPDIALGQIFSYLTIREKYWASLTCRNWYHAFHLSETWAVFKLDDHTLTRRRFNYYSGWQVKNLI